MTIQVITVGDTSAGFVGDIERLHGPITVVRRCAELAEAVAMCSSGIARAVIVTDVTAALSASLVERMNISDVAVIALSADAAERLRLESLGTVSAAVDLGAEDIAALVAAAVEALSVKRAGGGAALSGYADPGESLKRRSNVPEPGAAAPGVTGPLGSIIAVWGPTGAPGRTTVAVNLASELASAGKRTILIDADTYGASIAASLGLLDESAGLAQACRLADQGLFDEAALHRVAGRVAIGGAQLQVLTGITRPDRWPELRSAALAAVLKLCKELADYTVVDCGFCLEADEEVSFDTQAPRRNGATLGCLAGADTIYAVGSADALGVPRMVRALGELEMALPGAAPKLIFNKVRAASVGRSPDRALKEAWDRFSPGAGIHAMLPYDAPSADAAVLSGSALLEVAPASQLRLALAALAGANRERRRRRPLSAGEPKVKFFRSGVRL